MHVSCNVKQTVNQSIFVAGLPSLTAASWLYLLPRQPNLLDDFFARSILEDEESQRHQWLNLHQARAISSVATRPRFTLQPSSGATSALLQPMPKALSFFGTSQSCGRLLYGGLTKTRSSVSKAGVMTGSSRMCMAANLGDNDWLLVVGIHGARADWGESHGRDHRLIFWKLGVEDEQGMSTVLPVEHLSEEDRRQPWVLHLLQVNTLNFCSFAACAKGGNERLCGPNTSSALLLAVPNTLATEAVDIFALPEQSRLYTVKSGAKTGMVMSLGLLHHAGSLTLLAGFEDGSTSVQRLGTAGAWSTTYRSQAHSQPVLSLDVHPSREFFFTSSADSVLAQHPIPISLQDTSYHFGQNAVVAESSSGSPSITALSNTPARDAGRGAPWPSQQMQECKHPLKTINTKHSGQQNLRIRSDGRIFATAGWDSKIRVYSSKTMKELAVLHWHKVSTYAVAFAHVQPANINPCGGLSAQGTAGPLVDGKNAHVTRGLRPKDRRTHQATTTHWIVAGAKDGKVSLWDVY